MNDDRFVIRTIRGEKLLKEFRAWVARENLVDNVALDKFEEFLHWSFSYDNPACEEEEIQAKGDADYIEPEPEEEEE